MRRLLVILFAFAMPVLACDVGTAPTAVPTYAPPPVLQNPILGLSPVSGGPGTVINVAAAGFPEGAKVNLYVSQVNGTTPSPVAQSLTIGSGGILSFALQLPNQINGTALTSPTDLTFTISTLDNTIRANALFSASGGSGTPTATSASASNANGGGTNDLFITSPSINAAMAGNAVVVTGSGSALNNRVGVQLLDPNYKVLGSAIATIQAGAGQVGPWQVTVSFAQPASATSAYIAAYTLNAQGGFAEQASIPVTLTGQAAPTVASPVPTTVPPTLPPVITAAPSVAPTLSFITATPSS